MSVLLDDGNSDFIEFAGLALTLPITLVCWVKSDVTNINQACFSHGQTSAAEHWDLWVGSTGQIRFRSSTAAGSTDAAGATLVADTWTHIAGVQHTATSRFTYSDGVQGSESTTSREPASTNQVVIGSFSDSSNNFKWSGHILWPAIYDVDLDQPDITSLANGVYPRAVGGSRLVWLNDTNTQAANIRNLIGGNLPSSVNGTPTLSYDNPQVARLGARGRSRLARV